MRVMSQAFFGRWIVFGVLAVASTPPSLRGAEKATVKGALVANGTTVELPYVYVWAEKKGFYDEKDPTWSVLFVEKPVEEREIDELVGDAAWVKLGVTRTAEFGDAPQIRVYSQNIRLSSSSGGNLSGGTYPEIELESTGPDRFAGRVYHKESQKILEDSVKIDFTFSAPFSDPDAPIGPPLPAGGGEPGRAYVRWTEAIHSGDPKRLKALVPPEMAAELEGEDARQGLELMKAMTPSNVTIVGGESDGATAVLKVKGSVDGETVSGEVTLQKMGDFWIPTRSSW